MGSIVEEINKKTGRSDQTIAEAVANLNVGGGGDNPFFIVHISADVVVEDFSFEDVSFDNVAFEESMDDIKHAIENGKILFPSIKLNMDLFGLIQTATIIGNMISTLFDDPDQYDTVICCFSFVMADNSPILFSGGINVQKIDGSWVITPTMVIRQID